MLQEHEWDSIDLKEFYSANEGFSSWFYKVRKWIGEEKMPQLPEIVLKQDRKGQLILKERSIVSLFAKTFRVDALFIANLLEVDIMGLQTAAPFLFASEFSNPDQILLDTKPRQFCMSCFKEALVNREIPVFSPYWNNPWATHCIVHNSPLFPEELLDDRKSLPRWLFSDSTQYAYWCNRIEYAQGKIININSPSPDVRVLPTGYEVIALNKLFNKIEHTEDAVKELGLKKTPEEVRHQFFATFYLLSIQHRNYLFGHDLTNTDHGVSCFPTTVFFSSRSLEFTRNELLSRCMEYIANFISNPKKIYPYLMYREMIAAREEFSRYIDGDCSALQNDPMVFLAWNTWKGFRDGRQEGVSKMFPKYSTEWKRKVKIIADYNPRW